MIEVTKHVRPSGHEDDEECEEHQTRNELSLSSGLLVAGVGAGAAEALGASGCRTDSSGLNCRVCGAQEGSVFSAV